MRRESVTRIKWTRDYDKFEFIHGNRHLNQTQINLLKKEITNNGFYEHRPILCVQTRSGYGIVDGQHRFTAAKELGIELPYVVDLVNEPHRLMRDLNSVQRTWSSHDYIRHFSDMRDNPHYQRLRVLTRRYPTLDPSTIAGLITGSGYTRAMLSDGSFSPTEEQFDDLESLLMEIEDVIGPPNKTKPGKDQIALRANVVNAYRKIKACPTFSLKRMMSRAHKHPHMLTQRGNTRHYAEMFRDLYNYKTQGQHHVWISKMPTVRNKSRGKGGRYVRADHQI